MPKIFAFCGAVITTFPNLKNVILPSPTPPRGLCVVGSSDGWLASSLPHLIAVVAEREHVPAERRLQLRLLEKVILHYLRIRVALELDHHPYTVTVALCLFVCLFVCCVQ